MNEIISRNEYMEAVREQREMQIKTNKGRWCIYIPRKFCQEGFCDGCHIKEDALDILSKLIP